MRQFRLVDEKDKNRIKTWLDAIDYPVDFLIKIVKNKSVRSIRQNNLYWELTGRLADHFGYNSKKKMSFIFMRELYGEEIIDIDGGLLLFVPSTASLKTDEFDKLIQHVYRVGAEDGVYLPEPRDFGLINQDYGVI